MIIRPATRDELDAVTGFWLASYRDSAKLNGDAYSRWMRKRVARLLARSTTLVCEDNGTIQGWICGEAPGTLHFVYLKPYARRIGLARRMIVELARGLDKPGPPERGWLYTHRRAPYSFGVEAAFGWKYNPRLAR